MSTWARWVLVVAVVAACDEGSNEYVVDDTVATSKIQTFYAADPFHYWARYGVPTLVRSATHASSVGLDEYAPFASLAPLFDASRFMYLVESGELPADLVTDARMIAGPNPSPWVLHLAMYVVLVERLDAARLSAGYSDPAAIDAIGRIETVFRAGFDAASVEQLAPGGAKTGARDLSLPRNVCTPGADTFSDEAAEVAGMGIDDNNTERTYRWREVMSGSMWRTTYNGACATLAAGACAGKLGLGGFTDSVSCKLWNDVSNEVRDPDRPSGGTLGGMERFFAGRGYCTKWARDGLIESACEEAAKALERGCNVDIVYRNPGGVGHIENVDLIVVDSNAAGRCTVHTLSWGMSASVTFDEGRYRGKSDGARYGSESYLRGEGPAEFMYFCPCEEGQ